MLRRLLALLAAGAALAAPPALAADAPEYSLPGGGGSATFTGLTDTPSAYTGLASQLLRVNAGATGLEGSGTTVADVLLEAELDSFAEWDAQVGVTGTATATSFLFGDGRWDVLTLPALANVCVGGGDQVAQWDNAGVATCVPTPSGGGPAPPAWLTTIAQVEDCLEDFTTASGTCTMDPRVAWDLAAPVVINVGEDLAGDSSVRYQQRYTLDCNNAAIETTTGWQSPTEEPLIRIVTSALWHDFVLELRNCSVSAPYVHASSGITGMIEVENLDWPLGGDRDDAYTALHEEDNFGLVRIVGSRIGSLFQPSLTSREAAVRFSGTHPLQFSIEDSTLEGDSFGGLDGYGAFVDTNTADARQRVDLVNVLLGSQADRHALAQKAVCSEDLETFCNADADCTGTCESGANTDWRFTGVTSVGGGLYVAEGPFGGEPSFRGDVTAVFSANVAAPFHRPYFDFNGEQSGAGAGGLASPQVDGLAIHLSPDSVAGAFDALLFGWANIGAGSLRVTVSDPACVWATDEGGSPDAGGDNVPVVAEIDDASPFPLALGGPTYLEVATHVGDGTGSAACEALTNIHGLGSVMLGGFSQTPAGGTLQLIEGKDGPAPTNVSTWTVRNGVVQGQSLATYEAIAACLARAMASGENVTCIWAPELTLDAPVTVQVGAAADEGASKWTLDCNGGGVTGATDLGVTAPGGFTNAGGDLLATFDSGDLPYLPISGPYHAETAGTLPTGLAAATDYWLKRSAAGAAKVATSHANAVADTFVAYTDAGSGLVQFRPSAFLYVDTTDQSHETHKVLQHCKVADEGIPFGRGLVFSAGGPVGRTFLSDFEAAPVVGGIVDEGGMGMLDAVNVFIEAVGTGAGVAGLDGSNLRFKLTNATVNCGLVGQGAANTLGLDLGDSRVHLANVEFAGCDGVRFGNAADVVFSGVSFVNNRFTVGTGAMVNGARTLKGTLMLLQPLAGDNANPLWKPEAAGSVLDLDVVDPDCNLLGETNDPDLIEAGASATITGLDLEILGGSCGGWTGSILGSGVQAKLAAALEGRARIDGVDFCITNSDGVRQCALTETHLHTANDALARRDCLGDWHYTTTGGLTLTLPDAEDGLSCTFHVDAAVQLDIDPQAGDAINSQAPGVTINNATTPASGDQLTLLAIDGTNWKIIGSAGDWAAGS